MYADRKEALEANREQRRSTFINNYLLGLDVASLVRQGLIVVENDTLPSSKRLRRSHDQTEANGHGNGNESGSGNGTGNGNDSENGKGKAKGKGKGKSSKGKSKGNASGNGNGETIKMEDA